MYLSIQIRRTAYTIDYIHFTLVCPRESTPTLSSSARLLCPRLLVRSFVTALRLPSAHSISATLIRPFSLHTHVLYSCCHLSVHTAIQHPAHDGGCSVWEVVSPSDYFLHTERYQGCLPKSNYVMLVHHVIYLHRAEGSSEKGYFFVLGRNVFLSTCSVEDSAQSPLSRTSCICPFRYVVLRTLSTTSTSL
jgi:hypothetical protein